MATDTSSRINPRAIACKVLLQVMRNGQSLSSSRNIVYEKVYEPRDRGFIMELVQGVLRWRWRLQAMLDACLDKPLRNKEHEVRTILLMSLYELETMQSPDYAVTDEAVKLVKRYRKSWAKALVNAVLRRFQREHDDVIGALDEMAQLSHPEWLIGTIRKDWPDDWRSILEQNNERAPLTLRVNRMQTERDAYLARLEESGVDAGVLDLATDAIECRTKLDVTQLPGFADGDVSVQDVGAQLAANLLSCEPGMSVLDLCAAPGGKTCHVLEAMGGDVSMLAVDIEEDRLARVNENLQRLGLSAETMVADATSSDAFDDRRFDRIMLDAPCSATGVIRRHPDIKSLRRGEDIAELVDTQRRILGSAWRLLSPGGLMLYITCSVLDAENASQMRAFLDANEEAEEVMIDDGWGRARDVGRQLLPGEDQSDGFYYALVRKRV